MGMKSAGQAGRLRDYRYSSFQITDKQRPEPESPVSGFAGRLLDCFLQQIDQLFKIDWF
jgi:hypothetical protein